MDGWMNRWINGWMDEQMDRWMDGHTLKSFSFFLISVKKVVLCSGKHFYVLDSYRRKHNIQDTALIRLEVLY